MVPINELRVGNYLSIQGKIQRISLISDELTFSETPVIWFDRGQDKGVQSGSEADVQPVLLTNHILEKCGFVFHDYFRFWQLISSGAGQRSELDIDPDYNLIDFMRRPLVKKLTSLHQLQNLYFALKGKELVFQTDEHSMKANADYAIPSVVLSE